MKFLSILFSTVLMFSLCSCPHSDDSPMIDCSENFVSFKYNGVLKTTEAHGEMGVINEGCNTDARFNPNEVDGDNMSLRAATEDIYVAFIARDVRLDEATPFTKVEITLNTSSIFGNLDESFSNFIEIVNLDTSNKMIEGRFQFAIKKDSGGPIQKITEGYFLCPYQRS